MRPCIGCLSIVVMILGSAASVALASRSVVPASEVAVVTAPDGSGSRLLVKFSLPELPPGHEVYYADVQFHADGLEPLQALELRRVTTAWTAETVTWESPLNGPSGDSEETWIVDEDTGDLVKFVITKAVSEWASGADVNNGLLVMPAAETPFIFGVRGEAPVLRIYSGPKLRSQR